MALPTLVIHAHPKQGHSIIKSDLLKVWTLNPTFTGVALARVDVLASRRQSLSRNISTSYPGR